MHLLLLPAIVLLAMTGCSAVPNPSADPEAPYPPSRPPVVGDILHIPTGYYVSEAQMLSVATDARIVYVGETHDNPASHRLQLTVLAAMADRYPNEVALGMEMFTPEQQEALDRWVNGELDEKDFLKQSRWHAQWQMDFDYYRSLLDFARERKIPVIGLNAPKSMKSLVKDEDRPEHGVGESAQLPDLDLEDPYHGAFLDAMYGGHGHGESGKEGFRRVQTLWDETMAENVAHYLASPPAKSRRMVVVAGGNHIRHGFGIPRRVFRRLPTSYILIGSKELVIPEEMKDRLMDVDIPTFPMPPYDFLLFTDYEHLPQRGVKLGVLLDDTDGKVRVKAVMPDSVAEGAGLLVGDILLDLDGNRLSENLDLIYLLKRKQPGEEGALVFERDGQTHTITVLFPAPETEKGATPQQPKN